MKTILPLLLLAALLLPTDLLAGKNSDLGKSLGQPAVSDDFERKTLGKQWATAKGEWNIADGAISGRELAKDKHAAVLTYGKPNTDSAIQLSFKLDGTEGFHVSFNKSRGHLFRVIVGDRGISLSLDKDKKDPKSKAISLGMAKGKFEQGQWYTMLVVVEGENVSVQTDNGVKLKGTHATLKQPKPNYRFVMRGERLLLDDLKVWELK